MKVVKMDVQLALKSDKLMVNLSVHRKEHWTGRLKAEKLDPQRATNWDNLSARRTANRSDDLMEDLSVLKKAAE